jgi:polyisoprenyl-teichoic acid--peptidoglycan teichoic acid transferase
LRPDEPGGRTPEEEDAAQADEETAADADVPVAGDGGGPEPEVPRPATFAGRQRAAGDEATEEEAGFTDEVDQVERELGDELEEPEDEFAFAEDGGDGQADEEPEAAEPEDDAPEAAEPEGEAPEDSGAQADVEPDHGATVEADTLALADREEAREAALTGVRERAAKHEAKRQTATHAVAAGTAVATETEAPAEESEEEPAEAEAPAEPAPAAPGPPGAGEPPKPKALWLRFLTASLVIVTSMAPATAVSVLFYATEIAEGLGGIPGVTQQLTETDGGEPQTILILGSDKRPTDDTGRSDTAILLRVDPDNDVINLLSIPRDLRVNIPRHDPDKFNAAYSYGGPKLTLETVKVFTGLEINHVVNINFTGFADAVNALDCVYIDVDRRYFIPPESGIAEIDIEAGYQRLCGLKALQYVRFRHEDNDLVRSARQQDFLREARQGIPPSKLVEDRHELLDIFKKYTTSDNALKDPIQVIELIKTLFAVRNAPVHEIHFPAQLGGPEDPYVTYNSEGLKDTIAQFLNEDGTPDPTSNGEPTEEQESGDSEGGKKPKGGKEEGDKKEEQPEDTGPAMIDATGAIQPYAQNLEGMKTKGGEIILDFPLYFPTQVPANSRVDASVLEASRSFLIDGPGDDVYRGYKFVLGLPGSGGFTEYFGVSGTDWENAPILDNPTETREIDGRDYMFFYDGDRLRLIGWKTNKAAYWVNNTLLQTLEDDEMLAIARGMRELGG